MSNRETATFGIELQTDGTVNPAESAADAVERLTKKLDEDTQALAGMQRALRNLKPGGMVAEAQLTKVKLAIKAQQQAIAGTQSRLITLGASFKRAKPPANEATKALELLTQRFQSMGGPLARSASMFTRLRGLFAGGALISGPALMAGGIIALAVAMVAVTAAGIAAAAMLTKFALASADAYRTERLQLEGLTKLRNWYGLAADKASFLQQQIDRVSASSALGRSQISGLAQEFYQLNLRGGNLQAALEGGAIALATQGQAGLAQFKAMAMGARMYGKSIRDVTNDFKARLGPIARAQMLSLDVQSAKLRENLSALFRDIKIEPFLEALHSVTELFSQNTITGQALKKIVDTLFTPFFQSLSGLGPIAKRFFQGMVLGGIELAISILLIRNALRKTFGGSSLKSQENQRTAFKLGIFVVKAFGVALGVCAVGAVVSLGAIAAAAGVIIGPLYLAVKGAQAIGRAFSSAWQEVKGIVLNLINFDWSILGRDIINGFVNGIRKGYNLVKGAISDLGSVVKTALKNALQSHSPSKLSEGIAFSLPQGAAIGQKKGEPLVARASQRLGDVATSNFRLAMGDFEVPRPKVPRVPRAGDTMRAQPRLFDAGQGPRVPAHTLDIAPLSVPMPASAQGITSSSRNAPLIGEFHAHFSAEEPRARAEETRAELIRMLQEINTSLGGPEA